MKVIEGHGVNEGLSRRPATEWLSTDPNPGLTRWVKMIEMPSGDYAGRWAPILFVKEVGEEMTGVLMLKGLRQGEPIETVAVSLSKVDYLKLDEIEIAW